MSARKRRRLNAMVDLLTSIQSRDGIMIKSPSDPRYPLLRQLAKEGKVKPERRRVGSAFGDHIRRTFYVVT